jgi:hypothetical protein
MSNLMTDLMQHLQSVHTHHPEDDGRLIVAVPSTAHSMEQFEVREVHRRGPSVVLYCQTPQAEQSPPPEEPAKPQARRTRACAHNDYEDLC